MRVCLSWPLAALLLAAPLAAVPASAQERPVEEADLPGGQTRTDEDRLYDELVAQFQREYLRFTTLIQVAPVVPFEEAENDQGRIEIAAARFGIGGELGGGVGYRLQADIARAPALIDAYISFGSENVRAIVGRQRVPISYESLTSAADIPFVNRSRVVRALAPGREVGIELQASAGGPLSLRAGVFNAAYSQDLDGDEPVEQRRRGGLLAAGRVQSTVQLRPDVEVVLGANAAYDTPDTSDQVEVPGRLLLGVDTRVRLGAFRLGGEFLYEDVEGAFGGSREGGYATVGYDLTPDDRALVRLDSFRDSEQVLLGYNRALTRAASFQVNLVVPLDEQADPLRALANFQLAF